MPNIWCFQPPIMRTGCFFLSCIIVNIMLTSLRYFILCILPYFLTFYEPDINQLIDKMIYILMSNINGHYWKPVSKLLFMFISLKGKMQLTQDFSKLTHWLQYTVICFNYVLSFVTSEGRYLILKIKLCISITGHTFSNPERVSEKFETGTW